MAYAVHDDVMKRAGPEDKLEFAAVEHSESWRTGPRPMTKVKAGEKLSADESKELGTLTSFLGAAPYSEIMITLAQQRNICVREKFVFDVCSKRYPAHLASAFCGGNLFEFQRCMTKLARKTQYACKPEVMKLAQCYRESKADATKPSSATACFEPYLKFDMCTEDF